MSKDKNCRVATISRSRSLSTIYTLLEELAKDVKRCPGSSHWRYALRSETSDPSAGVVSASGAASRPRLLNSPKHDVSRLALFSTNLQNDLSLYTGNTFRSTVHRNFKADTGPRTVVITRMASPRVASRSKPKKIDTGSA